MILSMFVVCHFIASWKKMFTLIVYNTILYSCAFLLTRLWFFNYVKWKNKVSVAYVYDTVKDNSRRFILTEIRFLFNLVSVSCISYVLAHLLLIRLGACHLYAAFFLFYSAVLHSYAGRFNKPSVLFQIFPC